MFSIFFYLALSAPNMNGDIYNISNPNVSSNIKFSTSISSINNNTNYFDVYSPPITSRYGEVFWTLMNKVLLPKDIISKFNGKNMSIVGYEQDQVFRTSSGDISVPITWSYNHHYEAYLHSDNINLELKNYTNIKQNQNDTGQYNHGEMSFINLNNLSDLHNKNNYIQLFSEGNGGESRNSFHGYPRNYAQILYSPKYFSIQPMQIDTRNRDPKYINDSIFHSYILPNSSGAPPNASYSGLLECPCTTRITKKIVHNYNTLNSGVCNKNILNSSLCFNETIKINPNTKKVNLFNVSNNIAPAGCSFTKYNDILNITFNNKTFNSKPNNVLCGKNAKHFIGQIINDPITTINASIDINLMRNISEQVYINISGPSNSWFGIAFNALSMADLPYAIIVNNHIQEVKLGNHDSGTQLKDTLKIVFIQDKNNIKQVVLSRSLKGLTNDYYTFNIDDSSIPILFAVGFNEQFQYHKFKSSNKLLIEATDASTCLCDNGKHGYINNIPFQKNCADEPIADLIQQHNPSCFIETYQGGLKCCHDKNVLLDKNQVQPQNAMTYQLKFRFWYVDYTNQQNLVRLYFQTEAYSGEYDVPKCNTNPNECVHSITARWKASDFINKNARGTSKGVNLIYAGPHCHAPSCISVELYNGDTGDLICRVMGNLGKGTTNKFDEKNYIKLNPCVWGSDEGLYKPPFFSWDTNLFSIKKNNNTYTHYGEMASWQMRGALVY